MKVNYFCLVVLLSTLHENLIESRGIRRRKLSDQHHDYEASGDYFEVTVSNIEREAPKETTTQKATSSEEVSSDDGVTCSSSNFTDVLAGYELENHVLVIFKVNVSANERELVL